MLKIASLAFAVFLAAVAPGFAQTTWNPADKGSGVALPNGNLAASGSGGVYYAVRATQSRSTGKYCYENTQTSVTPNSSTSGFATSAMALNNYVGFSAVSVAYQPNGNTLKSSQFTLVTAPSVTFASGETMTFCVDLDAGKAWLAKNGTFTGGGNPAAGTNPWVTFAPGLVLFPAYATPDASNVATANFGASAFVATLPTGFLAWDGGTPPPPPPPPQIGSTHCIGANTGSGSWAMALPPGGRLTPESCTPVATVSQSVVTKIYYTGSESWRVPICNGTTCAATAFPQLEIELEAAVHLSGKIYDLFVFAVGGNPALCSSPEWSSNTAVPAWANGLTDGIETNKNAITLRCNGANHSAAIGTATFVGTFYATANGQTSYDFAPVPVGKASGRNGYVVGIWNAYNRKPMIATASDATLESTGYASWSYNAFAPRLANDNPNARIFWIDGRGRSKPFCIYNASISYEGQTNTGATVSCAVDWQAGDYGRPFPHNVGQAAFIDHNTGTPLPSWSAPPAMIGLHHVAAIEYATNQVIKFEGTQFKDPNHPQPWPDMNPPGSWLSFSTLALQIEM